MIWALLAFLSSFFLAYFQIFNQRWKLDGYYLVFSYRFLMLLLMLPFVFVIQWPHHPLFYLLVICTAPLVYYPEIKTHQLILKFGGGPVSRLNSLKTLMLFFLWCLIKPSSLNQYFDQPLKGLGVLAAISICVFFSSKLRRDRIDYTVMKAMIFVVTFFAFVDILNKNAMDLVSSKEGVFAYMFLQTFFVLVIFSLREVIRKTKSDSKRQKINPVYLKAGFIISLIWIMIIILKNFAFMNTPNPAYVTAIMLLSPIWVTIFNHLTQYPDQTNIRASLGVVCGIILLAILTI